MADLFNATYEVMLQMLVRFFAHTEESEEELQTLSSTAVDAMSVLIKPLGQLLTTLPVGTGIRARVGPSFEFYRTSYLLPHRHAAWVLMHERLLELAVYCARLGAPSVRSTRADDDRGELSGSPARWSNTSAEKTRTLAPEYPQAHLPLSTFSK